MSKPKLFDTWQELEADHESIKLQIKTWEKALDHIIKTDRGINPETTLLLGDMSQEMMSINI